MLAKVLLFVVIGLIVLVLLAMFLMWLERRLEIKMHKKRVYKILHYYAEEKDLFLLNDVHLYLVDDEPPVVIDHILFTDNYIYVISDFTCLGGIYGNVKDEMLFNKKEDGDVNMIKNPVINGINLVNGMKKFIACGPNSNMFMAMTVYNHSLIVSKNIRVKGTEQSCFIPINELEQTIDEAEKDDVTPIGEQRLQAIVDFIKEKSDGTKHFVHDSKKKKK